MDRSWMYLAPRSSQAFISGVQTFLDFAFERACVNGGKIKCPCTDCLNMQYQSRQNVLDHLICLGFRPDYLKWVYHGEDTAAASTSTNRNDEEETFDHVAQQLNMAAQQLNEAARQLIMLHSSLTWLHNSLTRLHNSSRKKVRGYTKKAETWKMNGSQKIIVTFNKFGKPVGDEGNELVQFLGTLVRMADHVSIEYSDWRKVPMQKKEDMYSLVKSKFIIHPDETSEIKKWIFHSMGKKWRTWKGALKARVYDPSLTIDEIVAQQANSDNRVNPTQFKELATRWLTPEFQNTCSVRRSSRSKMNEPHVTGTKSFARLAHERAMNNNGVYPTRGEMYVTTRTRKDGSIVDDKAAEVVASLRAIASDSTSTPGDTDDFSNDDYSKVKGPEKQGYVRLVGRMPAVKANTNSSTDSQTIHQLKSVVNVMLNIIQEHIPNANLSTVLSNMNIEIPGVSSSVPNNSLSVNQISPSGSNNNNGNG